MTITMTRAFYECKDDNYDEHGNDHSMMRMMVVVYSNDLTMTMAFYDKTMMTRTMRTIMVIYDNKDSNGTL